MDNSIDLRHKLLKITFIVLLALSVGRAAFAAPTANAASGLDLEVHDDAAKLPAIREMPSVEVKEPDAAHTSNATAAGLQRFMLPPPHETTRQTNTEAPLGHEISSSIKETLRPLHEDLAQSGIFTTIRNLESELGLSNNREGKDRTDRDRPSDNSNENEPSRKSWGNTGEASASGTRPRSEAEAHEDKIRASVMLQQLIDEVTPWIAAAVAIYLVGYGVKLLLAHKRAKAARRRSRNSKHSRHKRRSRHPDAQPQAQAMATDADEPARSIASSEAPTPK